jgi:hypothetical protein
MEKVETIINLTSAILALYVVSSIILSLIKERHREEEVKKKAALERERMEREIHIEEARIELERKRLEIEINDSARRENKGFDANGYIIVDMPEDKQPLFHDLLKGFEEYAKLKCQPPKLSTNHK